MNYIGTIHILNNNQKIIYTPETFYFSSELGIFVQMYDINLNLNKYQDAFNLNPPNGFPGNIELEIKHKCYDYYINTYHYTTK